MAVGTDKLVASINKVLEKYADDVRDNVGAIAVDLSKQGAKAINQNAKDMFGGSGDYAKSWKVEKVQSRTGDSAIIYSTMPGLPHLLEHGHAKRNGGRVEGRPHIAPVEEELCAQFEKAVTENI